MLVVHKVDPTRDTVKVCLLDDLDKLVDGPLTVDVLDVALVLFDEAAWMVTKRALFIKKRVSGTTT